MEKQGRYLKVKTQDGKVLMSLFLNLGQGIILEGQLDTEAKAKKEVPKNGGAPMTYPQKRFLFRILAGQGVDGDKANEHLINLFQADSLREVTKLEASRMIERLLKETKGGEAGGIPF